MARLSCVLATVVLLFMSVAGIMALYDELHSG